MGLGALRSTIAQVQAAAGDQKAIAIVDLGTNSTRLLVARRSGSDIEEIARRSTVTSLGAGVDLTGSLSSDAIERTCEVVAGYRKEWSELGVETVLASATSAVRDSANGDAFVAELRERFEIETRVLTGEEEAKLVFRGATGHLPDDETALVVDIGGGSTEIVVGTGEGVGFHTSLQAGVLRHTERHLSSDPPTPQELEALASEIEAAIAETTGRARKGSISRAIAVAGTPAALAAIERGEPEPRRSDIHGFELDLETIQRSLSSLSAMTSAERAEVLGLQPQRAPFVVAGTLILIQVMRAFGLDRIEVSESDLMHGLALESLTG